MGINAAPEIFVICSKNLLFIWMESIYDFPIG